jgi:hypothetical protein
MDLTLPVVLPSTITHKGVAPGLPRALAIRKNENSLNRKTSAVNKD